MKTTHAEKARLREDKLGTVNWRKWGPYLSDRQWGTVREDYSELGSAWEYFPHEHARSRAYRWGEDGIAGFSDDRLRMCLSLALWNGKDPILKERLFGLSGPEGNHGEDVKELYYYLDATPTHSYLKMLYKYPQAEFPYTRLVEENRGRSKRDPELELIDTGVFDENRYFDVFVEYAQASAGDVLMQITAHNRGPDKSTLHILPQVFSKNTWSWGHSHKLPRPTIQSADRRTLELHHPMVGDYLLSSDSTQEWIFTENESNVTRLWDQPADGRHFKDAFHDYVIHGMQDALNAEPSGTKAALHYRFDIPAGGSARVRLRLSPAGSAQGQSRAERFAHFDSILKQRIDEADEFYTSIHTPGMSNDARLVQRQAFAGMIWSKQYFNFDVSEWLAGDPDQPTPPEQRLHGRNSDWKHLNNSDVISMPDKWEYPWYAAWDLAFHCIPIAQIDPEFAKNQLILLTREWYMHPNGQLPAYEWAFGDVNPPVHAWASWRVYQIDKELNGTGDTDFLERVFHKLLLNFTWWVNRKDAEGRNIFQGGFLGLDNIGVFDRSAPLPTGGFISQSDGTSWMAMYCLNLMRIALELAQTNPVYEDTATKFFEHFLYIAAAMTNIGESGIDLWDCDDEFYYDVLCLASHTRVPLKVRSMVGLIPLFAVEVLDPELLRKVPEFTKRLEWFLGYRPDLAKLVSRWKDMGSGESHLLSLLRGHRMKRLLLRMLDETEFLSDYGVRALSRYHMENPYEFRTNGMTLKVQYQPAESDSGLFGGNSNWRGPIWMPVNFLIIESLRKFHSYYGDEFKVECPTRSGNYLTINQIADELSRRLCNLVLRDDTGRRPVYGDNERLQNDPHFKDLVLFYEYFHGDNGRGVGASHQTGWTGLLATLLSAVAETPRPIPTREPPRKTLSPVAVP